MASSFGAFGTHYSLDVVGHGLMVSERHVHVFSQGDCYHFCCPLLFVVKQGVEAYSYDVQLIRLLEIQDGKILRQSVPLGLNELPPGVEDDSLAEQARLLGVQDALLESAEDRCHVRALDVLPLHEDCPTFEFDFHADGLPQDEYTVQFLFVLFEDEVPDSADLVSPVLVDGFPDVEHSRQLLLAAQAESLPDQSGAIVLADVFLHSSQLVIAKDVEALQLDVLGVHLGENTCILRENIIRLQRVVVPSVEGGLLLLLSESAEDH